MTTNAQSGTGLVRIVNLEASYKDITLLDGSNIRLAPYSRGGGPNVSEPVLKKLLPPALKSMVTRRWIKIEEVS
jgi:hypothetical protein